MRSFASMTLCLAFFGLCIADGSPVYQKGSSFQNDQPIYSPDTAVAYSSSPMPMSVSSVTAAPEGLVYHPETYGDSYPAYPSYDAGYGVQNGYEGYLFPSYGQLATSSGYGPIAYLYSLMPYPSTVVYYAGKAIVYVAAASVIMAFGIIGVLAICTYTPYCHITFNTHNLRDEVRSFMTPDNLSLATKFVRDAIDKYQKIQKPAEKSR